MTKLQEFEPPPDGYFTCSSCGCHFEPDPNSICDAGISPQEISEDEEIPDDALTAEDLQEMDDVALAQIGITSQQRDELLAGKPIENGATIICTECQDRMAEEQ